MPTVVILTPKPIVISLSVLP